MKDVFGVKLEIGQYVAYAVRSGNSGQLKIGVIKKLRDGSLGIMGGTHNDYPSLKDRGGFDVSGKTGSFSSFDNIVVIPESIVPREVRIEFGTLANYQTSNV